MSGNNLIPLVEIHKPEKEKYIAAFRNFVSFWRNREVLRIGYGKEVGLEQSYADSFYLTGSEWITRLSWLGQVFLGISDRNYSLHKKAIRVSTRTALFILLDKQNYDNLAVHTLYCLGFIHPFEVIQSTGKIVPRVPWTLHYLPNEWEGSAVALQRRYFGQVYHKVIEIVPYGDEVGFEELPQPLKGDDNYPRTHRVEGLAVANADPYLLGLHHVHTYKIGSLIGVPWLGKKHSSRQQDYVTGLHMPSRCRLCDRMRVHIPLGINELSTSQIADVMDKHFQALQ